MTVDGLSDLDLSYTPPLGSPWDAIPATATAGIQHRITRASASGTMACVPLRPSPRHRNRNARP